jgi:hypothetical protein
MSAGDIIDRAIRLYRRNFLALLRIVIAPSLVAYAGSILASIGMRNLTVLKGDARIAISVLMIFGGWVIWAIGKAAFYAVLGGSSRSLVAHFFEGRPILARDVYRAVRERIWSLIGAMFMVGLMILGAGIIIYFVVSIIAMVFVIMAAGVLNDLPEWIRIAVSAIMVLVTLAALIFAFLLIYSRVVYVPQILMVENKEVFSSIGRSFTLAGGEVRRIAALFLFWFYVGWSVLWLLFIPLGWVSDWIIPFSTEVPLWYSVAWQTVAQLSEILLMPIFMLGCTLLYLDSRVRKEGFDVELLANRVLAPPPSPPPVYPSPAFRQEIGYSSGSRVPSILGLDDYRPITASPAATEESLPVNGDNAVSTADGGQPLEPVELEPIAAVAIGPEAEQPVSAEKSLQGASAEPVVGFVRKSCRWCGTEANVEDRFCRVCGSVF